MYFISNSGDGRSSVCVSVCVCVWGGGGGHSVRVFILMLENIRQNTIGINLPGAGTAKLLACADDTTFLVSSNKKVSGFKLNVSKTVVMGLGKWKNKADYPFGIAGKNEINIIIRVNIHKHRQPNTTKDNGKTY